MHQFNVNALGLLRTVTLYDRDPEKASHWVLDLCWDLSRAFTQRNQVGYGAPSLV
jgi:hypothetical protein